MKFELLKYCLIIILIPFNSHAKNVVMAFSQEIPPYIFENKNKGIEIDIIASALAFKGHTLKPLYFPLGRIPIAFSNQLVDAAMGDMGVDLELHGGFYAKPAVIYDNVFISLKSRKIAINHPKDLDNLSIVSFQGAEKRYPNWLSKANKEHRLFTISDQLSQVKLLHLGRYDIALCDRYIFQYFSTQLKINQSFSLRETKEHNFTTVNPSDYRPVFRDEEIKNDFNLGLLELRKSGKFNKIYERYLNPQ
jgi:polar amino acid transport system substrate-binding protein